MKDSLLFTLENMCEVEKFEVKLKKIEKEYENFVVLHLDSHNGGDRFTPYTATMFVSNKKYSLLDEKVTQEKFESLLNEGVRLFVNSEEGEPGFFIKEMSKKGSKKYEWTYETKSTKKKKVLVLIRSETNCS